MVDWVAIGGCAQGFAAIATLWTAWEARKAAKSSEKSSSNSETNAQLEIFLQFSSDYDELRSKLPKNFKEVDPDTDPHTTENLETILSIMKLFDKESFLYEKKLINRETWEILEPKIKAFIASKLVKRAWSKRNSAHFKHYDFSERFEHYVEKEAI